METDVETSIVEKKTEEVLEYLAGALSDSYRELYCALRLKGLLAPGEEEARQRALEEMSEDEYSLARGWLNISRRDSTMAAKKDGERVLEEQIRSQLRECHRLIGRALKKPDPSLAKLASMQLDEVTHLILMRESVKHVSEKDYEFEIEDDGEPTFRLRAQGVSSALAEPKGYV